MDDGARTSLLEADHEHHDTVPRARVRASTIVLVLLLAIACAIIVAVLAGILFRNE
jgi:hypothetical protein